MAAMILPAMMCALLCGLLECERSDGGGGRWIIVKA